MRPAHEAVLDQLPRAIAAYHAIAKDEVVLFPFRIQQLGPNADLTKGGPGGTKDAAGRLDQWVASLGRRAAKKAAYLQTLHGWINSAKWNHLEPVELMRDLAEREQSNVRGDADEPLLSVAPYARLEKIDPYHRNFVFFVNAGGDRLDPYHNNPMAIAFNQWLDDTADPGYLGQSFFEWLENHPICTGTPGVTPGFNPAYKNQVNKVSYAPALLGVTLHSGRGFSVDLGTGGGVVWLDTRTFPQSGKGFQGGCAFAWARDGNLWVHQHAGDFRHTSFMAGKKIRCSGMIRVVGGKVTHVSNESGHYRPDVTNLFHFADWLYNKGCMGLTARVSFFDGAQDREMSTKEFLTWGRANVPRANAFYR